MHLEAGRWWAQQRSEVKHRVMCGLSFRPKLFCLLHRLPAADNDDPALAAGTTAAWALSNVLKGAGREVGEVVAVEGAPEAIVRLVAAAPEHLATEAAWVLAYITGAYLEWAGSFVAGWACSPAALSFLAAPTGCLVMRGGSPACFVPARPDPFLLFGCPLLACSLSRGPPEPHGGPGGRTTHAGAPRQRSGPGEPPGSLILSILTRAHSTQPAASLHQHFLWSLSLNGTCSVWSTLCPPVQMLQDEQTGRALLIPLLRSLGNIAAGGGAAAAEQLLSPQAAPALQALVTCAGVRGITGVYLNKGGLSAASCSTVPRLPMLCIGCINQRWITQVL